MDNAVSRRPGRSCAGFRFLQRHTDFGSLIGSGFDDKSSIKSCGAFPDMAQSHAGSIDLGLAGLAKDKPNAVVGHFKVTILPSRCSRTTTLRAKECLSALFSASWQIR